MPEFFSTQGKGAGLSYPTLVNHWAPQELYTPDPDNFVWGERALVVGVSLQRRKAGQADGNKSITKAGSKVYSYSKKESGVDWRLTHTRGWAGICQWAKGESLISGHKVEDSMQLNI